MTSRNWLSVKAWLPTKLMPLTFVATPSLISKHEVDAILLELDDFWLDARREEALPAIDVKDALNVGLRFCARKNGTGFELDFPGQGRGIDLAVALKGNLIDDGIFFDRYDNGRALVIDRDVGKQPGGKQRLDRRIDLGTRYTDRPRQTAGTSAPSPARRADCRRLQCP